jgi:hypothetical protein
LRDEVSEPKPAASVVSRSVNVSTWDRVAFIGGTDGELSDDNNYINMPFEDVHRLVMTMRMVELILNDRVQSNRKDKMAQIKAQLDADCGHNTAALLTVYHNAKDALTQSLVMTMRMVELILNDRVQSNRKDKMAQIKAQLDADCGHNTAALLAVYHR